MAIGIVSDSDFLSELNSLNGDKSPKSDKSTPVPIPVQDSPTGKIEHNDDKEQESASVPNLSEHYPPRQTLVAAPQHRSTQPGGTLIQDIPVRGRKKGDVNVPDSLRKLIAETALMDGRQAALDLARDFGLSPSSVSAYTNGATSTTSYNEPKSEMISHINGVKARAIKRASKTLNGALKAISQDKLDNTDAKDLAGIARDMTVVIKNLTPDNGSENPDGPKAPQFVVFAPQFRDERSFESITINE